MRYENFLLFFVSFVAVAVAFVHAQSNIGEVGGSLFFNVSLGSTQTNSMTIINAGDEPLGFRMVLPTLTLRSNIYNFTAANTTLPVITISPMNGTMPPHTQQQINVTVYMPVGTNKPNLTWEGLVQALATGNPAQVGGASIQGGVGKVITIRSAPEKPLIIPFSAILLVIMIAAGTGLYYATRKKKETRAKKSKERRIALRKASRMAAKGFAPRPKSKRRRPKARAARRKKRR